MRELMQARVWFVERTAVILESDGGDERVCVVARRTLI